MAPARGWLPVDPEDGPPDFIAASRLGKVIGALFISQCMKYGSPNVVQFYDYETTGSSFLIFNGEWSMVEQFRENTTSVLLHMVLQIQFHFHITLLLTVLIFSIPILASSIDWWWQGWTLFFSQSDGQGTLLARVSSGQSWPSALRSVVCTCLWAIKSTREKGTGWGYGK